MDSTTLLILNGNADIFCYQQEDKISAFFVFLFPVINPLFAVTSNKTRSVLSSCFCFQLSIRYLLLPAKFIAPTASATGQALTGLQELISVVPNPSLEVHCPTVFACGMRIYLLKSVQASMVYLRIWQHEKLYTRICYLFCPPKTLARPEMRKGNSVNKKNVKRGKVFDIAIK
nr:hypothetical protein Iba_chr11aCG2290 [Ipomoea batatas]